MCLLYCFEDKLEEAKKLQVGLVEKQLQLVEKENNELRKMLNESRQLIFNKSQPEVELLKSQIDFLKLDQNDMPIGKLQEAFEEQISIAKKQWESLQDRKMHIKGALTDIITVGRQEGSRIEDMDFEKLMVFGAAIDGGMSGRGKIGGERTTEWKDITRKY